jgi:hypothetical protein
MWKFILMVFISWGFFSLSNLLGIANPMVPFLLLFFGCISFLFGPEATSGGFYVKTHYVSSGTPAWIWKTFGVILWISSAAATIYIYTHPERCA